MNSIFLIILLFATWSLAFPLGKSLLAEASPILLTGLRMLLAGIVLLSYLWLKKKLPKSIDRSAWISIVILGFISIFLTNILEFYSLKYLTSAKVCFLYSLSPFLTALFSYFHFNEKMTKKKWIGMSIAFTSIIIGFTGLFSSKNILLTLGLPDITMLLAVILSVYGWIILRMLVKNSISPIFANAMSMLVGGAMALITHFFVAVNSVAAFKNLSSSFYLTIVAITIISNLICYNLYGHLLKRYTATFLSFFGLLSPIFTTIYGYLILNETPSLPILFTTPCIILGLFIFYQEELKQGYVVKKTQ